MKKVPQSQGGSERPRTLGVCPVRENGDQKFVQTGPEGGRTEIRSAMVLLNLSSLEQPKFPVIINMKKKGWENVGEGGIYTCSGGAESRKELDGLRHRY